MTRVQGLVNIYVDVCACMYASEFMCVSNACICLYVNVCVHM